MQRWTLCIIRSGWRFQSMHPIKDATLEQSVMILVLQFQSMHPIKDATVANKDEYLTRPISIHAPYKGCNKTDQPASNQSIENFNPCTL